MSSVESTGARDYPFYVVFQAEGSDPVADEARFERVLEEAFEQGMIVDAALPKSESEVRDMWNIREDFEAVVAQMDEAGMPCVEERDEAWAAFCRMRAAFEPQMLGLCRLLLPPPSAWGTDLLARPLPG